jgi:hypothetical protein
MSKNEQTVQKAERLVRDILVKDFKQKTDDATVHAVALKVAKAIPSSITRSSKEHAGT